MAAISWFVGLTQSVRFAQGGLGLDDPLWDVAVFPKNRESGFPKTKRLLAAVWF